MPTRDEYRARLIPRLQEGLAPLPQDGVAAATEGFSVETLADELGGILEELERQHRGASAHVQALAAGQQVEPWDGHGELAFVLYYLHHPPAQLRAEIDATPALRQVWDAMEAVAAESSFDPASLAQLAASLPAGGMVRCNKWGDIYGLGQYEQLDPRWAWTLKNTVLNHLPRWMGAGFGIAEFVRADWSEPLPLQAGADGRVRIAILGDWGSGTYALPGLPDPDGPACAVMDTLAGLDAPPDYLIHLGDTYYSGTGPNRSPSGEVADNLVGILRRYPALARTERCFTLNSNHEMYGGAYGYYRTALADPLFAGQRGCSYFALEFGEWIVAGIDSAYFDPSSLYMDGGLGNPADDPQFQFLAQLAASGKRVILMSHHTGLQTDGSAPSKYLWHDVTRMLTPEYWYWGHTHLGMVYNGTSLANPVKARCIGHGSMPFAVPPGMQGNTRVDWYSQTPLVEAAALQVPYYTRPRARNGFAVLTLSADGIEERIYEIGRTTPVWSR